MTERGVSPKVSVVVPVYNDGKAARKMMDCLLRQTLPPHEIIVVDDGSTDDTLDFLKEFGDRIILLTKWNGGPASARNYGIRISSGEFVAFTDSDCLPHQTWLSELVKGFDGAGVGGVGGVIKGADPGLMSEYADEFKLLGPAVGADGKVNIFATANVCFRREVLLEARLFDEHFTKPGGEDVELCYKIGDLGYEFRLAEGALVLHHHRRTLRAFLKTMSNYGEGQYILDVKWPDRKRLVSPGKELVRSAVAVRSMLKRCLAYRVRYGIRRAALFSFLDHYGHSAYTWGYLRGQRNCASGIARRTTPAETKAPPPEGHDGLQLQEGSKPTNSPKPSNPSAARA